MMNQKFLAGPNSPNQYANLRFFRKGGMGEIYTADDTINNKIVAVKVIAIDNNDATMLEGEFEIALKLKNNNIIETYHSGRFHDDVEYFYSVMEFVQNGSLNDFIKNQQGFLDINVAIEYMLQLSNGLLHAHNYVMHRDLKPDNILNNNGQLLICDFGLSKYIGVKTRSHTFKGWGSMFYMSPEAWELDTSSKSMDLYSLGIIFFEILTLERPFKGTSNSELKSQHLYKNLPSIKDYRNDVPVRLQEMIHKLTSKRPADRYKDISEVITILKSLNSNQPDFDVKKNQNILNKAQEKIAVLNQQQLEEKKQLTLKEGKRDFLNYSINALFEKYIDKINELNVDLEREKIVYNKDTRKLFISFLDKSATITFYSENYIQEFIQEKRRKSIDFQMQRYSFIINDIKDTYLQKDNVVIVGKMIIGNWSCNLVLKKDNEEDLYGDWEIILFVDSGLSRNYKPGEYGIDLPDFFEEYELGRDRVMHARSMKSQRLDESIIDFSLEKLIE